MLIPFTVSAGSQKGVNRCLLQHLDFKEKKLRTSPQLISCRARIRRLSCQCLAPCPILLLSPYADYMVSFSFWIIPLSKMFSSKQRAEPDCQVPNLYLFLHSFYNRILASFGKQYTYLKIS